MTITGGSASATAPSPATEAAKAGAVVFDREGRESGLTTGVTAPRAHGFPGRQFGVRCPDGALTFCALDDVIVREDRRLQLTPAHLVPRK